MTYRVRNIVIAVALALVAALMTSFYVTNYQRNVEKDAKNVEIFVAKRDIPVGTSGADLARKGLLEKSKIVRRSVVPGAISTRTSSPISSRFSPSTRASRCRLAASQRPRSAESRAQITGTMRAFQVPGDQHQLLAGTLKAGDHIDVVASLKVNPDKDIYATRIVLRDIEVLKAPRPPGRRRQDHVGRRWPLGDARHHRHAGAEALPRPEARRVVAPAAPAREGERQPGVNRVGRLSPH